MAYEIEVKYFNSFWLKKVVKEDGGGTDIFPSWPGLPWEPEAIDFSDPFAASLSYPTWPFGGGANVVSTNGNYQPWFVEEARIKGGFNNTSIDYGVKAYIVEDNYVQQHRFNSMIYSGIYNSRTGTNKTNVFSIGSEITRTLNPIQGSIQKLYAEDGNLIIFQEHKVSGALIDKDAIYSAEGGALTTTGARVIGQVTPYLGEYGISTNPESFAIYGYRKYFTDKNRGIVLRLSRDGITEISAYGMKDYFRDNLKNISDTSTKTEINKNITSITGPSTTVVVTDASCDDLSIGAEIGIGGVPTGSVITNITGTSGNFTVTIDPSYSFPASTVIINSITYEKGRVVGGWDIHDQMYIVSIQDTPSYISSDSYSTVAFDEASNGWPSFYSYKPAIIDSLAGRYYSSNSGKVYEHHDELTANNRCNFYDAGKADAYVEFIFNPNPSMSKNFNTVNYEGSNGWEIDSFVSDFQGEDYVDSVYQLEQDITSIVKSYDEGKFTDGGVTYRSGFNRKENKYVANLKSASTQKPGEVIFGDSMSGIKGYFATVKISTDGSTQLGGKKELFAVSSNFVMSSY